ncbi:PAS/PAC sensor hybrid histidine kinase [Enhygromyxa salina]|uniref:histidine kinase n=1 Tax=Enhygromyxa salina TaxID=215803 RepID=A0A0C2CZW7_9BACT|nr:PAS/PAC sensor hybrid histidine kinase [Enhygromyxa salina]
MLRDSERTRVHAAVRESDQRRVLVKVHELDDLDGLEVRIEHEFRMIHGLELEGIVGALAYERSANELALVLDWCEGVSLEEYRAGRPLPVADFMSIAVQLARILAALHRYKVIHRNIKPSNVFINPKTKAVSLGDFGISVVLESERQRINEPRVIDHILPYVSPEQTGRTHHEVDFRSDLYSLGVTLYELLAGRRPFEATTPLELIHAHLARRPQTPQRLRPELPTMLSAVVMKLLEKAPERRYQSARGLLADLERINAALTSGTPTEAFSLGADDVPAVLQLPHRLYGRSREVEKLSQLFRESSQGHPHCVLISGPTGIGKTALVTQLTEAVLGRHGYFARGKFEREQMDKPYAGVFAAFSNLADQLLTRSDAQLEPLRANLLERLGPSCFVLHELVPKLRPILGAVPAIPELGPVESRNQLALACAGLIAEFARVEHPLVLSLDDLQWADEASCELIASLLVEPDAALLVVGTLHTDDLPPDAPAQQLIELLQARASQATLIELGPLSRDDLAALIADALGWPSDLIRPLAEIVGRNTNHNPFFVGQYLAHLVELGLLRPTSLGWEWDAGAIEAAGLPEDLLSLMTAKLALLTEPQRELLAAAAVIGMRFDVATLGALVGNDVVSLALVPMIKEGLLTSLPAGRYGFTHDRIREATYQMSDPERRAHLHRIVGEKCLERSGIGEIEESIFDMVDHLDLGYGLVPFADESPELSHERARRMLGSLHEEHRSLLAELNALAGHNAQIGAAHRAAVRYFEAGIQLVSKGETQADDARRSSHLNHELRFSLELGRCQALGLAGKREQAERHFDRLLQAPLDFARVGRAIAGRVELRIAATDRLGAIACGMDGLTRLGVQVLPDDPSPDQFPLNRLVPMLRSAELRRLGDTEAIRDQRLEAALEILTTLIPVSHLLDTDLHVAIVTEHTRIMLAHGRHRSASLGLSYAAMIVGTAVGQRQLALEIVELARALANRPGSHRQRIEPPYWVVASWVRPYADGLAPLRESVGLALGAGDSEVASYATDMSVTMSLSAGVDLRTLERMADAATRRLRQWQAGPLIVRAEAYLDFASSLTAGDESVLRADEQRRDALARGIQHLPSQYMVRLLRAWRRCLIGDWQQAFDELDAMDDFQRVVFGAWHLCDYAFFHGLSAAGVRGSLNDEDAREQMLWVMRLNLELLEGAAELAPANCVPRAAVLAAEVHAAEGNSIAALASYSTARRSAVEHQLPWVEAIALERSALYLRELGLEELAQGPMRDARARFASWGAFTKVAQLERLWPELVDAPSQTSPKPKRPDVAVEPGSATSAHSQASNASRALDLASILKASQAIAGDIQLDDVVDRVMAIALENAGAERGALLLPGAAGFELAALCSADGADSDLGSSSGVLPRPVPVESAAARVPVSLLRWVERTREPVILDDAATDMRFASDPYIAANAVRSVLSMPILKHDRLVGLLYLENKLSTGSFTIDRLELLHLLMAQAASALENAQLFEALRGSEVRWRSLVEGLPDVVMLVDPQGRLEFINHFAGEFGGEGEHHAVIGAPFDALVHPDDADGLHEQISQAVRELRQTELELRAALRSAKMRWYALRLAPIAVDGRVERVIAVATDITERRDALQAREQLEAQIRQQQRLESIGTLASGVAHEINNPVQGIMNYAELIATMPGMSEVAREFAGEIGYESQRVAAIVRSLLSFSREESEHRFTATDIGDIIEGTLLLVRTVIGKDQIELSVDRPMQPIMVECRAQQLRQVIMNLVTNARDALCSRWPGYHEDKRINIRVQTFDHEDGRAWLRISVGDKGGGIPAEVVGRIFDPFFTTKGRDQGTGLGLSVSHGIISDHGGELRLENDPGVGACFHVELPTEASHAAGSNARE